ncbi:hypothetical protein Taro_046813 [Colocasia esculenta]|uniref:Cation/H+ exchanger domain-containing protein n=1 Tax=Colocasia esculenta TaxID=4460 RepID=A0A843X4L9_COLES|nr:hypothetical protein [Colocasia esculenta]
MDALAGSFGKASCFAKRPTTSSGLWFGDNPLRASLPLLLFQMSLVVACFRGVHLFLRHVGQSETFSQILAGLLLGPYGAGSLRAFQEVVFPLQGREQLNTVAFVGYNLFMFTVGVKTDLGVLRRPGRKVIAVGLVSSAASVALVLLADRGFRHMAGDAYSRDYVYRIASSWCVTSFPVLSLTLAEMNLLNSKLGHLVLSTTLMSDMVLLPVGAIVRSARVSSEMKDPLRGMAMFLSFVALVAFIWLVARPVTVWMIRKTPEGKPLGEGHFMAVLMLAFACAVFSEVMGHHAGAGMFMLGLALPSGPPLGSTLARRVDGLVGDLFIPVFMVMAAFRVDFTRLRDVAMSAHLQLFLLVSGVGKMVGVMAPCLWWRTPLRDSFCMALMMNIKGIYEINVLNSWHDRGVVDDQAYAVTLGYIFVSLGVITPLVKALYKPHRRYAAHKRRTMQQTQTGTELSVMVCVHGEEDVPPAATFLLAFSSLGHNPLAVYVLHLVQLVGRAAPLLRQHHVKQRCSASGELPSKAGGNTTTPTDRIANAFRQGRAPVQTFVSVAPYASMHDDICALAFDKRASLLVLPFHRKMGIDGRMAVANSAFQGINNAVLDYAPCSVGILVDKRLPGSASVYAAASGNALRSVAMCFLGGPDDREALACVARMAGNPDVAVAVVQFQPRPEWKEEGRETRLDKEAVTQFRSNCVEEPRVVYREEVVHDAEGMVGVIREMSSEFDLFVVGRRHGADQSPVTAGLAMWSEYPELGIVGDMLASTDFPANISTLLVVQQQRVDRAKGR